MGEQSSTLYADQRQLNHFTCFLINDIKALQKMLETDRFEKDVQRIGAEQELCLLDRTLRPAPIIMDVLDRLKDDHFKTEHSQYNLEINLDPIPFRGDCLGRMEKTLHAFLKKLEKALQPNEASYILAGILPTIRRSDLNIENLTPLPRYHLLNEVNNRLRGGPYEFRIEGADELITRHNSIMFEGCNTSFQVHLQVPPADFASLYNWAQAITGPVLAASVNSPILLGMRLWHETRIALFQQSVDTRTFSYDLREKSSRITFGERWVDRSITEIYEEDLSRYRVLVGTQIAEDSLKTLEKGSIPELEALRIHNGTVYKWNRPCYGITAGKPHLRIENRYLPSGPTVVDEIANAAFWLGLMNGMPDASRELSKQFPFDHARMNFLKAARTGLETQFQWLTGKLVPADQLILRELLPLAREGLKKANLSTTDVESYLGIIEQRVRRRQTGSRWMLDSFDQLRGKSAKYESSVAITASMHARQKKNEPVHTWPLAKLEEAGEWINRYWKVEQIMTTDLFTVQKDDLLYFASNVMSWKRLRYIPVENEKGRLVGLLSSSALLGYYSTGINPSNRETLVGDIMIKNPRTVTPQSLSVDALTLMRKHKVGCLPVVSNRRLVGMLTEINFMNFSEHTLQELREESKRHAEDRTAQFTKQGEDTP